MSEEKSPLFSIIVPAYKLETLLPRCLDSLLAQTFTDWECVVVDDGSPDGTGAVADAYAGKDARFNVLHKANGGVSSARNAGMEAARGALFCFLDGDDYLEPFALEWLSCRHARHPRDLLAFLIRAPQEAASSPDCLPDPRTFPLAKKAAYLATGNGNVLLSKVFSSEIIRAGGVRFDPALARGEDAAFFHSYVDVFFRQRPDASILQYDIRLYVITSDNGAGRASSQKIAAHAVDWDPEASRGYAARLMEEYADLVASMGGWEGFAPDERLYMAHQYARRFAFAVWAARQLGEALPAGFWSAQGAGGLTAAMARYKLYCAYYWPLRLRLEPLIAAVYQSDESESKRLYWKVFLIGDLLLGRRWNRL